MSEKIKTISIKGVNSYLIKTVKGFILIDMGYYKAIDKLEKALSELNGRLSDIFLIIITHSHVDHVGGVKKIKKLTNSDIIAHENGKKYLLNGRSNFPAGTNLLGKFLSKMGNMFFPATFESVTPNKTFGDIYNLSEYGVEGKVIHTPGHSSDSCSVIVNSTHCFVGDTLFNLGLSSSNYPIFADDEDKLRESIEKLYSTDCKYFYPGHGRMFKRETLQETVNKLKK